MTVFILCTLAYITGMAVATLFQIEASGIFLLVAALFFVGAAIPFWSRHSQYLINAQYGAIMKDEEPVPVVSVLLLLVAFVSFGVFRYVNAAVPTSKNHIEQVMRRGDDSANWTITGRITEEPRLRGDYLEVIVQPETAQEYTKPRKGEEKGFEPPPAHEVDSGLVLARVFESTDAFRQVKFNQRIELRGFFSSPSTKRNPGSLDFQRFLRNRGIFRTIRIVPRRAHLAVLSEDASGAPWYRFALYLRTEILKVIKQTMPYPESSFLGGVLLGLRGGLPSKVADEFRMTGVSHVLAVSGLHVTIIAGLLYAIFSIFKVPIKVFAPIIVFSLFTFALIVGWPSSAVRAALMNSMVVLAKAYFKEIGFQLSIVFSLSVAAAYILSMNPLQLTEPSFVLSVMAIYALAMFTKPAEKVLRSILRGNGLAFAFYMLFAFYLAVIVKRDLSTHPMFFPMLGVFFAVLLIGAKKLSETSTFQSFSFEMLPQWLQAFTASQIAIFVAMMGPLSAFYFGQMSLAAPLANMIAIPLIGIIVQAGLIAGLVGAFLPGIGIYIALLINAANWLAIRFFLGMASFFAFLIPFPMVSQPSFGGIVFYYLVLHLVFYYKTVKETVTAFSMAAIDLWQEPEYKTMLSLMGALAVGAGVFLFGMVLSRFEARPEIRSTMLDVGYGSSVLVEKRSSTMLLDAGFNDTSSGFDAGARVIMPALSEKNIKSIDAVLLTSALPERISGLAGILENYRVGAVYAPFDLTTDGSILTFPDYVKRFDLGDARVNQSLDDDRIPLSPPNLYWEQAFESYKNLVEELDRRKIPTKMVKKGDQIPGFEEVEILYPTEFSTRFNLYRDGAIIRISDGQHSTVYSPANMYNLEKSVDERFHVLLLADNPHPHQKFEDILKVNNPHYVAISFRRPATWLMDRYHLGNAIIGSGIQFLRRISELSTPIFRTDRNGAFQVDLFKGSIRAEPFVPGSKS